MTYQTPASIMVSLMLLMPIASNSPPATREAHNIVLHYFSKKNYVELQKHLGQKVCVTGNLSIDSMGVYYPLQPIGHEDVIDIGFSRINTGLSRLSVLRRGMVNGKVYTVCGLLKDATPFHNCDTNLCKWYALTNADPRTSLRERRP